MTDARVHKVGDYLVPYHRDGGIAYGLDKAEEFRPNEPFRRKIWLKGWEPCTAGAVFFWEDEEGREFPMLARQLADMLKVGVKIEDGAVEAVWDVRKVGTVFSLRFRSNV